ncbi:MAG: hypothetical protein WD038_07780 [Balneolales bacterium]
MLLAFASYAEAQSDFNSTFRFLNIPSSARAAGLGGVNVALPDADVTHSQMNPAHSDKPLISIINVTLKNI